MEKDKVLEVMAGAFCFVGNHCKRHCPDLDHRPCPDAPSQWGDQARAILAALEKEGYMVRKRPAFVETVDKE